MANQNNIIVGDHVRIISGCHTDEIATVGNITRLADQFGPYTRVLLNYEGGKVANRSMDSLEKVFEPTEVRR